MRRALPLPLLVLALAPLAVGGCGGLGDGSDGRQIVATTTVLGNLARQVAGRRADVRQLLQPNSDPHDYEPRPRDVVAIAGASVVLASGLGLDDWVDGVVEQSGGDPRVVDVGARVPIRRAGDPHWWHDPRDAAAALATIRDALARADPTGRAVYARNAARAIRAVRALDAGIRRCFADIPRAQRKLVTDHDALGYLADRYGLRVVGAVIPSLTTQAQPSAGDLAELADAIRREHVATVFSEQSVNPKLAQAIARETGARVDDSLYGDALGPAGSAGATYVGMMRHDASAIVGGLTGGRGCAFRAGR